MDIQVSIKTKLDNFSTFIKTSSMRKHEARLTTICQHSLPSLAFYVSRVIAPQIESNGIDKFLQSELGDLAQYAPHDIDKLKRYIQLFIELSRM